MADMINTPMDKESAQSKLDDLEKALTKRSIQGMPRRRKIICLVMILLIIAAAGFAVYKKLGNTEGSEFLTAVVTKSTITNSIEATGTLNPVKSSEMGFKNDDTITAINVEPGDHVKAGQVLAEQDPTSLKNALQQAQSTVEQDQISVQSTELSLESNRKTLERQQKLYEAGAIPESDLDTAQNNFKKSQLELATAKAKLANDQIKVEQAQSDLSGAALVAPFDGIIGTVNGQVGQINGINSSTSTLLSIMSEDLQISALINEADISQIKVGQEAEFTTTSITNKTFTGQVLRITPQAQTVSNIQYYPVLISCNDPEHQLLAGMSVSVNIIINQKKDVLTIPMMAVTYAQSYSKSHPSGDAADKSAISRTGSRPGIPNASPGSAAAGGATNQGQPGKVVVLQNDKPVVKTVVLGLSDGSNYEIIQGLEQGDKVIVGSSQADQQSSSSGSASGSNSNSNRSNRQNQGGGMGGPPPGGF